MSAGWSSGGRATFMNEGLQGLLLPPDLKNTIALSLVSYGSFDVYIMHRGATSFYCRHKHRALGIRRGFKE